MDKQKILVVDDETSIVEFIEINLKRSNFDVLKAYTGTDGLLLLESEKPDLMVLDLMLPDMTGFDVCKKARLFSDVPIIILTAKGDDYDKIVGLESGADDYMVKPFNPWELIARIQAILRRVTKQQKNEEEKDNLVFGNMKIDSLGRKVWKDNKLIELTPREYDLLMLFSSNPGKSFSREDSFNDFDNLGSRL